MQKNNHSEIRIAINDESQGSIARNLRCDEILTVSRSSKIQIGFTFLVPAYPGCPGEEAVKW